MLGRLKARHEPFEPEPCFLEVEIAVEKCKVATRYLSNSAEMIQTGCKILCSEIHKGINFIWNKEELPQLWEGICYYKCQLLMELSTF
jgi:hypothetical protein